MVVVVVAVVVVVVRTAGYKTTWPGPARGFGIVSGALPSVARV